MFTDFKSQTQSSFHNFNDKATMNSSTILNPTSRRFNANNNSGTLTNHLNSLSSTKLNTQRPTTNFVPVSMMDPQIMPSGNGSSQ